MSRKSTFIQDNILDTFKEIRCLMNILDATPQEIADSISKTIEDEANIFIKEERENGVSISKNGSYIRTVKSLNGLLKIKYPTIRNKKFESKILSKYTRTTNDFNQLIELLLMFFMSYDQIIDLIYNWTGIRIGHSLIAKIANKNKQDYSEYFHWKINDDYEYIFIDACYYKVKKLYNPETGEICDFCNNLDRKKYILKSQDMAIYTAIGIDKHGYKRILSIECKTEESTKNWTEFLEELKERGMNNPKVFVSDDFKGISNVITQLFPKTKIQKCVIHKVRNALNHVSSGKKKMFKYDLRKIYVAETRQEAEIAFLKLKQSENNYDKKAIKIIEDSLDEILTFLELPQKVRRFIYTNNISEAFNSALRKYVKEKCSFPYERTLMSLVNVASLRISRKWSYKRVF